MESMLHVLLVGHDPSIDGAAIAVAKGDDSVRLHRAKGIDSAGKLQRLWMPQIVIMGRKTGERSGLELLALISKLKYRPYTVLVLEEEDELSVDDWLVAGVSEAVKKPFSSAYFASILRKARTQLGDHGECVFQPETLSNWKISFLIRSSKKSISPILHTFKDLLSGLCDEMVQTRLEIALQEIFTNALEHGNLAISGEEKARLCEEGTFDSFVQERSQNSFYRGKRIAISASYENGIFSLEVEDEGKGFDWRNSPGPQESQRLKLNGRGIFLIKKIFDEVLYNEAGNKITVNKKLR